MKHGMMIGAIVLGVCVVTAFIVACVILTTDSRVDNGTCIKVLATGDSGEAGFGQYLKANFNALAGLNTLGCANPAAAVLLLGDNFYQNGVTSINDPLFKQFYENEFDGVNLRDIPHYVIAGNHDHYSTAGVAPQIAYKSSRSLRLLSSPRSSQWTFPAKYYTKEISTTNVTIFVIFIDTWDLVGGDTEVKAGRLLKGYETRVSPEQAAYLKRRFLSPIDESTEPEEEDKKQRELEAGNHIVDRVQFSWIEEQLKSEKAQSANWRVVVGHYPVRSASPNHGETIGLVNELEPMMRKFGVDAYFAGHDHVSQIIDRNDGSPIYYGNGAGNWAEGTVPIANYPGLQRWVSNNSLGFFSHIFTKDSLTTRIHIKAVPSGREDTIEFVQLNRSARETQHIRTTQKTTTNETASTAANGTAI